MPVLQGLPETISVQQSKGTDAGPLTGAQGTNEVTLLGMRVERELREVVVI